MSSEEGWSLDFCLACDNQTSEGAYCSQSCRLADLDKGQFSFTEASHSPTPSQSSLSSSVRSFGFFLPPAFDFTSSRTASRTVSPSPAQEPARLQNQHWSFSADTSHPPRNFTPLGTTSSRSSVSLDFNTPNTALLSSSHYLTQLSDDARQQLEIYDNAFDVTRHRKHRSLS